MCTTWKVEICKQMSQNVMCFNDDVSPFIKLFRHAIIRWCWDGIPEERPSFRVLADDIKNLVPENCATV